MRYKAKNFNDAYLEWVYGSHRRDPKYINWKQMKSQLIVGSFPLWGLGGPVAILTFVDYLMNK